MSSLDADSTRSAPSAGSVGNSVPRPERWATPFGEELSAAMVQHLLQLAPFSSMDPDRFPRRLPLAGLLANDCRVVDFQDQEIVLREGDYGHSAFLILQGTVDVALRNIPPQKLGRLAAQKLSWWDNLAQALPRHRPSEYRAAPAATAVAPNDGEAQRIFLQDFNQLVPADGRLQLGQGEIFGELAALSRTPRTATVVSRGACVLLEIRWQGLRDLIKFDPALRAYVHELYRSNSLRVHLRETEIFRGLDAAAVEEIAAVTEFESYGDFEWQSDFRRLTEQDALERIDQEPRIIEEGHYPNGLILIRSGFARQSRAYDDGRQTVEYLGKGRAFGLEELWQHWRYGQVQPYQHRLSALGYVDVLRIPTAMVEQHGFARNGERFAKQFSRRQVPSDSTTNSELELPPPKLNSDLMEFIVEERLLNATRAMVIDLDRCTRCDDCLKACATTHDGNPRFKREGPVHDRLMFAQACMHCQDPVCMIGCPTGAIGRDQQSGVISINDQTCIGCTTCAESCPYDNIQMVEIKNRNGDTWVDELTQQPLRQATKCDACHQQPSAPACQNACPHDALIRIDLTSVDPLSNWLASRHKKAG